MSKSQIIKNTTDLTKKKGERLAEALKALAGCIPLPVIPRLAEWVIDQCPFDHQIDRMADVVGQIEEKLQNIGGEVLDSFQEPENLDRLSKTLSAAKYAEHEKKRERLARVFVDCVSDQTLESIQKDRIIFVVSELDEGDIIWLEYYRQLKAGTPRIDINKYITAHQNVIQEPPSSLDAVGASPNSQIIIKRNSVIAWRDYSDSNLAKLGLVTTKGYPITTQDNPNACEITEFGKLLLEVIRQN